MKRITMAVIALLFAFLVLPAKVCFAQQKQQQIAAQQVEEASSAEPVLVSMDFENADIRDVIKVVAMASGMNMVIGKGVDAKVTISLKDIPWERALDVILRTYNFTYKKEENLIRIMTFAKVKEEARDIPLITKITYLNFAEVGTLQSTLAGMLSDRGSIEVDARTNSMLITDIPAKVEEVERIARELDTRTPQVLIEAMLVDVKLTKGDELGINWDIVHVDRHKYWQGKDVASAKANDYNYIEQPHTMSGISGPAIEFGWLEKLGTFRIDGLIKAWAQEDKANILASPKIVTLDNLTAKIEIKSQVAYTKYTVGQEGGDSSSTQFKDVTTGLEVTPHITKEGFVSMNLKPRQEFIEGWTEDGQPYIGSRSAETNVLVKDGETIVIGGLRKITDSTTITKVPILGDIPLIGGLFRKKEMTKVNTELVMFVTPHIIIHPELTDEEMERYKMLDEERDEFLRQWEKEREKKLKRRRRKQAKLVEPEFIDLPEVTIEVPCPEERIEQAAKVKETEPYIDPCAGVEQIDPCAGIEQIDPCAELEKAEPQWDTGYIYAW